MATGTIPCPSAAIMNVFTSAAETITLTSTVGGGRHVLITNSTSNGLKGAYIIASNNSSAHSVEPIKAAESLTFTPGDSTVTITRSGTTTITFLDIVFAGSAFTVS